MHDIRTDGTGDPKNLAGAAMTAATKLQRIADHAIEGNDVLRLEMLRATVDLDRPSPDDWPNILKMWQQVRLVMPIYAPAAFMGIDHAAGIILWRRLDNDNEGQPRLTAEQNRWMDEADGIDRKLELRRAFILQEFGEAGMADLLMKDPVEYHHRLDEGRAQHDAIDPLPKPSEGTE